MDVDRLKQSWQMVAAYGGDRVALRFYSYLFIAHPQTRELFPMSMSGQRDRLVSALGHAVSNVDQLDTLVPFLEELGRDHRKFGVVPEHFGPVGEALLATLADVLDTAWTSELAEDWTAAYGTVSQVMIDAAAAAGESPPWWDADVVMHERRALDIAVVTVRPRPDYGYRPGQSVTVECHLRPRMWRHYSPANAPRADGTIDLHVRRQPGGPVSTALVGSIRAGDTLRLGPPVGRRLTINAADGHRDLLLVAGGTGLAPLKALVEEVADQQASPVRRVLLAVTARTPDELYDLQALWSLAGKHEWLEVRPVVDGEHTDGSAGGPLRALAEADWRHRDVYVCGSDRMVNETIGHLAAHGVDRRQLHYEGFVGLGGDRYGIVEHL